MKKLLTIIIIIIAISGVGLGSYFATTIKQPLVDKKINKPAESNNAYIGDDFTIISPTGWIQTHLPSTLVSFQNPKEIQPKGSAAEKINFKTYIAVSFDNAQGKTLNQVTELVRQQVVAVVPSISFAPETIGTIDSQPAKFMEAGLTQQNVEFKVMVAVVLKGDTYFTISNNTTAEKWPEYRDLFYNTADSFKFKY